MSEKKAEPRIGDIDVELGDHSRVDRIGHVVNEMPEPELIVLAESARTLPDGTFERLATIEIRAPYTVPKVTLEALADGIVTFGVFPTVQPVYNPIAGRVGPTAWHAKFGMAGGQYGVRLVTERETPVRFGVVWQ